MGSDGQTSDKQKDSAICTTKLHISSSNEQEGYQMPSRRCRRKRLQTTVIAQSSEEERPAKKNKSSNLEMLIVLSDDNDIIHPISSTPKPTTPEQNEQDMSELIPPKAAEALQKSL